MEVDNPQEKEEITSNKHKLSNVIENNVFINIDLILKKKRYKYKLELKNINRTEIYIKHKINRKMNEDEDFNTKGREITHYLQASCG